MTLSQTIKEKIKFHQCFTDKTMDLDCLLLAVAALEKINSEMGRVCPEFETCTHKGCTDSHHAGEVSDVALTDIEKIIGGEG